MEGFSSRGIVSLPANQVQISEQEFRSFHSIDRRLFAFLVVDLWRDPVEAMQVMALWLWLERAGFFNIVKKVLQLPAILLNELADEAVVCLRIINNITMNEPYDIPLTQILIQKDFSLQFLLQNQEDARLGVDQVRTDICVKAFSDIMQEAITLRHDADQRIIAQQSQQPQAASSSAGNRNQAAGVVPAEDRTMFVTFSKGYPVAEGEVRSFFTNMFGECIESFYMQDVTYTGDQPLFARIVFFRADIIPVILNGVQKAKFTINGKHIWMRKFIPHRRRNMNIQRQNNNN